MIRAYAARQAKGPLTPIAFDPGPLAPDAVEIDVLTCGICHSDLSMLDNEWGFTQYPFVPGHEVVGKVAALGSQVRHLKAGQTVGLGWFSRSCMTCGPCMSGDHNLCATGEQTIVGRHGGFADKIRCQASWALPIPDGVDPAEAGPLFCGGITVFNPIASFVRPTDRVGVVGIGGLGHMAVQFLSKWGCEVVAFTSSPAKHAEARKLGAHRCVDSRDSKQLAGIRAGLDLILVTANVPLDWPAYIEALGPRGRLHFVGAVLEPVPVAAFSLIMGMKSISGSPVGSPALTAKMLEFAGRHKLAPVTEHFPLSQANQALDRLRSGKARYRVVLDNDLR